MNPKTASLPELRDYYERQRQVVEEKLRHVNALLEDDDADVTDTDGPGTKPSAPAATSAGNGGAKRFASGPNTLKSQAIRILAGLLKAEDGPFTQRDFREHLAANGLQVTKQVMSHTVKTMLKQGLIIAQDPPQGSLARCVYVKGPHA